MKATITKIIKQPSKINNGSVYMATFKCEDGKSRVSWIDDSYGNFRNWNGLLKPGNRLDNLAVSKNGYIDADSHPRLIPDEPQEEPQHEHIQEKLFEVKRGYYEF